MKEIQLTQGKVAIVDDSDYDLVSQYRWSASKISRGDRFYAQTNICIDKKRSIITLHRLLLGRHIRTNDKLVIDHIDNDPLNNRRNNLRLCTRMQNSHNHKLNCRNTSGYTGVSYCKSKKKWASHIWFKCKNIALGRYDNPTEAAKAYDQAALKYHGEFARLNFPQSKL